VSVTGSGRIFVAVRPPGDVADRLSALDRPVISGLRWTIRDQWHVTLRFLGPVGDLGPVRAALAGVEGTAPAVAVVGPTVGHFGRRILHLPVDGLDSIAAGIIAATAHLGCPPDERPFRGHLTLGRVGKRADVDLGALAGAAFEARWDVDELCLYASHLSSAGARYQMLDRFPLTNR